MNPKVTTHDRLRNPKSAGSKHGTAFTNLRVLNYDRVNAVKSAEQNHSCLYLLLYRRLIMP